MAHHSSLHYLKSYIGKILTIATTLQHRVGSAGINSFHFTARPLSDTIALLKTRRMLPLEERGEGLHCGNHSGDSMTNLSYLFLFIILLTTPLLFVGMIQKIKKCTCTVHIKSPPYSLVVQSVTFSTILPYKLVTLCYKQPSIF